MTRFFSKVIVCLIIPGALLAQQKDVKFTTANFKDNPSGLKFALKKLGEGNQHIQISEYGAALSCYLSADSLNHSSADLNTKIGVCYLNGVNKAKCLTYFRTAYNIKKNISVRINFFLGRGYQLNNMWDSAVIEYQLAMKSGPSEDRNEATKCIEECGYGSELMQQPVKTTIENMGNINSSFSDLRPFVSNDGSQIIFATRRHSSLSTDLNPVTGEYNEVVAMSHFKNGVWDTVEVLDPPVNSLDNNKPVYVSRNGKTLYYTRDGKSSGLYKCTYDDAHGWSIPEQMNDSVFSVFTVYSMCFSPDGKTMYFVSNRPGGIGKKDIYVSTLGSDETWGTPVNIGSTINTPYDEDGVYMNPDGKTLYFSSKGHNSMGGYDIFMTVYDGEKWSEPKNLGYPINTPGDDVYFTTSADGYWGYEARITDDNKFDIYKVNMSTYMPKEWAYKGSITDSISHNKLKVGFEFIDKSSGAASSATDSITDYSKILLAGHQYSIRAHAKGYQDYSLDVNVPDTATYRQVMHDIKMMSLASLKPHMADSCVESIAVLMERFKGGTKDTNVVKNALLHLDGSLCLKNLRFSVQLGIFHSAKDFNYKKYVKKANEETMPNGDIRVTSGEFEKYEEAKDLEDKLKKKGLKDAWIVGIYNGKRYVLKDLLHPAN